MTRPICLLLVASLAPICSAQVRLLSFAGEAANDRFGAAVGPAGDVDGDGFADVLVGAPTSWAAAPFAGWAALYSGRTGAVLRRWNGTSAYQGMGSAMCTLGDIDNDGVPDFAIAAAGDRTNGNSCGRVFVISGASGAVRFDFLGEGPGDLFGSSVAAAGDVDRDGIMDLIAGAPENGDPIPNYGPGYAKVFSGRTGALLHRWNGRSLMFEQGHAVDGVGDVDGDGHSDLVVAAPLDDSANSVGAARVYSGRTGALLHTLRPEVRSDHYGAAVCGVGDTDGDGVPDIAVGAAELGTLLPGNVTVYSGRTGARLLQVRARNFSEMFGVAIGKLGDVNGDGRADFAVGSPGGNGGYGTILVYSGRDGSLLAAVRGERFAGMFALPMAVAGDVNGDGLPELIAGARQEAGNTGAAHVYSIRDVARVGAGCGQVPPALASAAWHLGLDAVVTLSGGEAHVPAQVFLSLTPARPGLIAGACAVHLDLASLQPLATVRLDRHGGGGVRVPVPYVTELLGVGVALQAVATSRLDPLVLSNGVFVTLRW